MIALPKCMSECSMLFEDDEPQQHSGELRALANHGARQDRELSDLRTLLHNFDLHQVGFGIAETPIKVRKRDRQVEA